MDRGPDGEVALELVAGLAADHEWAIVGWLLDAVLRERRLLRDLGHHLGARLHAHAFPFGFGVGALPLPLREKLADAELDPSHARVATIGSEVADDRHRVAREDRMLSAVLHI